MEDVREGEKNSPVTIAAVLATFEGREVPVIPETSSVEEAIQTIVRFPHTRLLYVVDEDSRLVGTISLGNLVRHFFRGSHQPKVHPRLLISMITTEKARDIMEGHPIFATKDQDVELVLQQMIEKNVKEIAVLDEEEKPIADVTMIDLLQFLIPHGEERPNPSGN